MTVLLSIPLRTARTDDDNFSCFFSEPFKIKVTVPNRKQSSCYSVKPLFCYSSSLRKSYLIYLQSLYNLYFNMGFIFKKSTQNKIPLFYVCTSQPLSHEYFNFINIYCILQLQNIHVVRKKKIKKIKLEKYFLHEMHALFLTINFIII